MWELSIPKDIASNFTWLQAYIQQVLSEKGASVESIIGDLVSISKNAQTSTPLGDMIDDYKTQMNAKKLLLEMAGVYKQKWGINMNFDFSALLFNGKDRPNNQQDTWPQQWTVING